MARASRSPGCIAVWRRPSSPTFNAEAKNEAPFELGTGVINVPFAIPNIRIENPEAKAHTRIGGSDRSRTFLTRSRCGLRG